MMDPGVGSLCEPGNKYVMPGDVIGKGMESANNDARKWPIIPFDVSRDFISKEILV